jgi:UDP-glucose 4-epimerase
MSEDARNSLTVAVTGPTGDIGLPLLHALEQAEEVGTVRGLARSPFDPAAEGLHKVAYQQGNVLDREAVRRFVEGADVVVHLAFLIMGNAKETRQVNVTGSRQVFEETVSAGVPRLLYASSVAAYGFHESNPQPLTEDVPARGTDAHYYSAQKAELEAILDQVVQGTKTETYVFRPCIVAGPEATLQLDNLPFVQLSERLPSAVTRLLEGVPILRPVLPDPGIPFQLVHQDDVASALAAAALGRGKPGVYNLAGEGELTMATLARELGWYSIPLPELAVDVVADLVTRIPGLPAQAYWITAMREPVIMDTAKARRELGWKPQHDTLETLRATIRASRLDRLVR